MVATLMLLKMARMALRTEGCPRHRLAAESRSAAMTSQVLVKQRLVSCLPYTFYQLLSGVLLAPAAGALLADGMVLLQA